MLEYLTEVNSYSLAKWYVWVICFLAAIGITVLLFILLTMCMHTPKKHSRTILDEGIVNESGIKKL